MRLRASDWLVIFAVIMLIGAHSSTQFIRFKTADIIGQADKAENYFKAVEANPIVAYSAGLNTISFLFSFIVVPGTILGVYYGIRRKFRNELFVVNFTAMAFFYAALMNVTNDLAVLVGLLAAGG